MGKRLEQHVNLILALTVMIIAASVSTIVAIAADAAPAKIGVNRDYVKLPLSFEENRGQTDRQVKFLSHGRNHLLFITPTEAVLTLQKPSSESTTGRFKQSKPSPVILSEASLRARGRPSLRGAVTIKSKSLP